MKKFLLTALAALAFAFPSVGYADTSAGPVGGTVFISGDCAGSGRSAIALNCSAMIGVKAEAWDTDLDCLAALSATGGILKKTGAGTCAFAVSNTDYLPINGPQWSGVMAGLTGATINTPSKSTQAPSNYIAGASGSYRLFGAVTINAATPRWVWGADNTSEAGGDVGSNFEICDFVDAGTLKSCPLTITRTGQNVTLTSGVLCFTLDCNATGTSGMLTFDGSSTFILQTHNTSFTIDASLRAASLSLTSAPLPIASGGSNSPTAAGAPWLLKTNNFSDIGSYITAQNNLKHFFIQLLTQFDKAASTGNALVPAFNFAPLSGENWKFSANLFMTGDATGGIKFHMGTVGGTLTVSSVHYHVRGVCNTTGLTLFDQRFTDITSTVTYSAGCTSIDVQVEGAAEYNGSGGSFGPVFAQFSASGTSSVLVDSTVDYQKTN